MQAIEFETDVVNGQIELPPQLKNKPSPLHLRIDAMFDEKEYTDDDRREKALRFPYEVGTFSLNWSKKKLTREEMNAAWSSNLRHFNHNQSVYVISYTQTPTPNTFCVLRFAFYVEHAT